MTYKQVIEELCVVNFLSWDHDDPMGTVMRLLEYEVQLALDPRISKQAVDLITQYGGCFERQCPICESPVIDGKCQDIGNNNCTYTEG